MIRRYNLEDMLAFYIPNSKDSDNVGLALDKLNRAYYGDRTALAWCLTHETAFVRSIAEKIAKDEYK